MCPPGVSKTWGMILKGELAIPVATREQFYLKFNSKEIHPSVEMPYRFSVHSYALLI